MMNWLDADRGPDATDGAPPGWPRTAGRLLAACMALLAAAASWLILTRPVHRIEGDFLEREDRKLADAWLLKQLQQPIAEQRARAHLALSRIQGRGALDRLVRAMADPAPSVRARAAFATGVVLDVRAGAGAVPEAAAEGLIALLEDDERVVVTSAVEALGKMRWVAAAPGATRTAAPIASAMTALMRMGAADQSDFVAEYLDSDDQDSRWAASLAAAELQLVRRPLVWERLQKLVTDDNDFVRAAALRAVSGGTADRKLLAKIRGNLEHHDPKVRYEAAKALESLAGSAEPSPLPAGEPILGTLRRGALAGPLMEAGDYQRIAKTLGARLRMSTSLGDFEVELDYEQAPLTSEYVRRLAVQGGLDGSAFAAVRPNGYAVAAAGLHTIASELNPKPFLRGSLGLLRQGNASGGGFFLCLTSLPLADGRYVNFGRLVSGDRLLDSISAGTTVHAVRELR